ncbi:MAG TPA: hypothetical protein VFY71_12315 [Planctomycetota bacterium]|nr:hypothetical protein [Planctomycetota bacterium]
MLVVCKQDKDGEPWRLQLLDQGKEVWTRTLTQVPSEQQLKFEGEPKPLGAHGWVVPMSFGEYTAVYLDDKAELLFDFTSW